MITGITPYNVTSNKPSYKPEFKSAMQIAPIPVKRRGEVLPENLYGKFVENVKDIFFEMFPKLDPEYKSLQTAKSLATPKKATPKPFTEICEPTLGINYSGRLDIVQYIKTYKNPEAAKLYKELQKAKANNDTKEVERLTKEMGDYDVTRLIFNSHQIF